MVEREPGGEQLKNHRFRFIHEDVICEQLMRRAVTQTIMVNIPAENRRQAALLAENEKVIGACGHVYYLAKLRKK